MAGIKTGVTDYVDSRSFGPYEQVAYVMKGSEAVLYIGSSDPYNRRDLGSKLYDYIGSCRPILVLADPSFRVAESIINNGFGVFADPDDSMAVVNVIKTICLGKFAHDSTPDDIASFTRQRSVDGYIETLDEIYEGLFCTYRCSRD